MLLPTPSRGWPTGRPADGTSRFSYERWLVLSGSSERLRSAPTSPRTIAWLVRAQRVDEALTMLQMVVDEHPEQMAEAFERFDVLALIRPDANRDYGARARDVLRAAHARLSALPREQQAAAAMAMIPLEHRTQESPIEYADRLRRFLVTYAGTQAADLVSVDLVTASRLSMATIAALDELVTTHPGTEAAAKALHQKAFNLSRNAHSLGLGTAGSDPTDRFLDVLRIATELESGKYPPSRWVDQAPELVTGFSFFQVKMSPQNAERALFGLTAFARAHFQLANDPDRRESFIHLLSRSIPEVASQTPDGPAAIGRVLGELERAAPDPAMVRFARGTPPNPGTLEADTLAVRDALFLPMGGGLLAKRWNAQEWPQRLPSYLVVPSELRVKVHGDDSPVRVDVSRPVERGVHGDPRTWPTSSAWFHGWAGPGDGSLQR